MAQILVENLLAGLEGKPLLFRVGPPSAGSEINPFRLVARDYSFLDQFLNPEIIGAVALAKEFRFARTEMDRGRNMIVAFVFFRSPANTESCNQPSVVEDEVIVMRAALLGGLLRLELPGYFYRQFLRYDPGHITLAFE